MKMLVGIGSVGVKTRRQLWRRKFCKRMDLSKKKKKREKLIQAELKLYMCMPL
jgi:hypothetical protein